MVRPCDFLQLIGPFNNDLETLDMREEKIIRTDSITYISCAVGDVFIQYRGNQGIYDILTHIEHYDSIEIALERFDMILKIMGAAKQSDLKRFVDSAKAYREKVK